MAREIVLDTETTGFEPHLGHRLVELAALEIEDFVPTGRSFHVYIDPERDMPEDAERVHGLSGAFLRGKPKFADTEICQAFIEFIGDAPVVAHNAGFDRAFVNWELEACGMAPVPEGRWIDTLALARKRFPGMHNSLDALCKRFKISLSEREKHGALIDARLLAAVYLELRGGRERGLELSVAVVAQPIGAPPRTVYGTRPKPLADRLSSDDREAHRRFITQSIKSDALWSRYGG